MHLGPWAAHRCRAHGTGTLTSELGVGLLGDHTRQRGERSATLNLAGPGQAQPPEASP